MQRMKDAGYGERFRKGVLQQAMAIYNGKVKEERTGTRPLYRPKSWKKEERKSKKRKEKQEWLTKGGHIAPIFVPASPGGELAKRTR